MELRVDSIVSLRTFAVAADTLSFTLAGQTLGVSPSAVGKTIAKLEEQLATTLFHRTTRTISLTQEGELYLEHARRVLAELLEAETELAQASHRPSGRLRISLPLTGSTLTPVMADFGVAYPDVSLDLDYTDRIVDVIGEGFDAVIRTGGSSDSRLMSRKLGDFQWMLAAAPSYIARHGEPKTPADLVNHACLRQRLSSGRLMPWQIRNSEVRSFPATFTASIIDPLIELAIAGAGVVAIPSLLARDHFDKQRLKPVLRDQFESVGTLNILWPSSRYRTPKVRAFVDFLAEWARKDRWEIANHAN